MFEAAIANQSSEIDRKDVPVADIIAGLDARANLYERFDKHRQAIDDLTQILKLQHDLPSDEQSDIDSTMQRLAHVYFSTGDV